MVFQIFSALSDFKHFFNFLKFLLHILKGACLYGQSYKYHFHGNLDCLLKQNIWVLVHSDIKLKSHFN